jgi:integrase
LLNNLNGTDYYICLIALKCGLRAGEIIGLTDLSFNFKEGTITIDKQWKKLGNKEHGFGKPKSKNSYRDVPIPASYIYPLKKYVRGCVIGTDRRIFLDATTGTAVNRIKNKMNRLGLNASIHDLRHTYATTLLANGFDYKTVAELMGDNVQTIIRTYSHFTKDMFDSAKTRIDNIL